MKCAKSKPLRHGEASGYSWYRCRCDECVTAYQEWRRARYGHRPMSEVVAEWRKRGEKTDRTLRDDELERVWANTRREGDCLVWTRPLPPMANGDARYPQIFTKRNGRRTSLVVHRAMYETFVAKVASELHVHHACLNPACVNPAHLEPLTPREHSHEHMRIRQATA
jgi:hypothetical protein